MYKEIVSEMRVIRVKVFDLENVVSIQFVIHCHLAGNRLN